MKLIPSSEMKITKCQESVFGIVRLQPGKAILNETQLSTM